MMRYMTMFITIFVTLLIMLKNDMKIKWIDESQGVSLEKFMNIEMVAVKSCKSPVYFRWNGWQNIIIEIEYGDTGIEKAGENSQYLETYDAMRKTTESEREAKDPITTSTYATEDDDIVGFSFCSQSSGSWKDQRLRLRC